MRRKVGIVSSLFTLVLILGACEVCRDIDDGAETSGYGAMTAGEQGDVITPETTMHASTPGTEAHFTETVTKDRVYFGYDASALTEESKKILAEHAEWLKKNPAATATVQGHCDERGTTEYNLGLGSRRAHAAKEYLVSCGVEASRINVVSLGKEQPFNVGHNEEAWAENRVSVTIVE